MPEAEKFYIDSCHQFSDIGLTAILTHCTQLRQLAVECNATITDAPLAAHAHRVVHLQSLILEGCDAITGSCAASIAAHCTSLHTLNLSYTATRAATLQAAIPELRHMRKLVLENCAVDDATLSLIATYMLQLEHLDISMDDDEGAEYTCAGLIPIAEKCEKLKHLDLRARDVNELTIALWQNLRE